MIKKKKKTQCKSSWLMNSCVNRRWIAGFSESWCGTCGMPKKPNCFGLLNNADQQLWSPKRLSFWVLLCFVSVCVLNSL